MRRKPTKLKQRADVVEEEEEEEKGEGGEADEDILQTETAAGDGTSITPAPRQFSVVVPRKHMTDADGSQWVRFEDATAAAGTEGESELSALGNESGESDGGVTVVLSLAATNYPETPAPGKRKLTISQESGSTKVAGRWSKSAKTQASENRWSRSQETPSQRSASKTVDPSPVGAANEEFPPAHGAVNSQSPTVNAVNRRPPTRADDDQRSSARSSPDHTSANQFPSIPAVNRRFAPAPAITNQSPPAQASLATARTDFEKSKRRSLPAQPTKTPLASQASKRQSLPGPPVPPVTPSRPADHDDDDEDPDKDSLLYSPIPGNPLALGSEALGIGQNRPLPTSYPGPRPGPPKIAAENPCNRCPQGKDYTYAPCGHEACRWCWYQLWESAQVLGQAKKKGEYAVVSCGACSERVLEVISASTGERSSIVGAVVRPALRVVTAGRKRTRWNPYGTPDGGGTWKEKLMGNGKEKDVSK